MQEQLTEILIQVKGTLKHKWVAISVAWLLCLLGWGIVMFLPNTYTSEAKVHIDSKTMLEPLLEGISVKQDSAMLVRVMKQLMFTTPNLDKIIELSNLDLLVKNDAERLELYDDMKKEIKITGGKKDGLFTITYDSNEPNMAKNVVTSVLTVFSEQTQLSTMEDVNSSQRFIEQQIREYEVRLRSAEKTREAFKRSNFGLLPKEGEGNGQIGRLNNAYQQLDNAKLELSQAISKRDVLINQVQDVINSNATWVDANSALILSPEEEKIKKLRQKKMNLLLKYTESHPAVSAIDLRLEEVIKRKERKINKSGGKGSTLNAGAMANPYVQKLKTSLAEAKAEVASIKARVIVFKKRIEKHKEQLDSRLTVETEMQNLNRDYETIRDNYQKLVQRREQARMAEQVDTETVSIKFKIVDPPTKPLSPSGPKRLLLLSGVLLASLAAGFGLAFLFYFMKPTFITTGQVRKELGLPVLGSISMVSTNGNNKKETYMYMLLFISLVCVYIGLMIYEYLKLHSS
ncbi:MAG: hypothetical protein L3J59_05830 [Methylococcaceae bacterium]|nr:hypothetical protein [Methylococcaceae bacterium]